MRVLIVEDEALAADRLETKLKQIDPECKVVGKTGSVKASVKWLMHNSADLIFLDIQLSDGLSFSIFDSINVNTPVIFTTAFDQYAIKAFQLNSISYLLKPVRTQDLQESLKKYRSMKSAFSIDFEALSANYRGEKPEFKKRFLIRIGDKLKKVETSSIACFYSMEKSVFLKTFENANLPVDFSLDALENFLDPETFFRINRKYIININAIKSMIAWSRSRIKLELDPPVDDAMETIVSIERSADFRKWMNS